MSKKLLALIGLIIIVSVTVRYLLLGGASVVSLGSAPALNGLITQAVNSSAPTQLQPGKDFNIQSLKFFDNNSWAVASISSINHQFNPSTLVIQQQTGDYEVVLGPGTAFDNSYLLVMPADVGQYLKSLGVIYGTVSQ